MGFRYVLTDAGRNAGWVFMHLGGWVRNPESRYASDYAPAAADELADAASRGEFVRESGQMIHVGGILYHWQPS
jgi:hypothetical protein